MGASRRQPKSSPHLDSPQKVLRPENRRLLAFLDELAAQADDVGETSWEEFRASLRRSPL